MKCEIVGQRIDSANPAVFYRRLRHRLGKADAFDRPELERPLFRQEAAHLHRHRLQVFRRNIKQVPEPFRSRHLGHVGVVLQAVFRILE